MPRSRSLDSYPRPGITVDLAVLTVTAAGDDPRLRVLVQTRVEPLGRALPGAFVRERRTIAETTTDVLRRKVGLDAVTVTRPELLRLFDDPKRDDRTWAISVGHSISMTEAELTQADGDLVPVLPDGRLDETAPLLFDHDEIISAAVARLRHRYEMRHVSHETHADPDGFLTEPFTLHQLRKVHEAVLGTTLHKDNFNRRMRSLLEPVIKDGEVARSRDLRGRPATLYVRAKDRDPDDGG